MSPVTTGNAASGATRNPIKTPSIGERKRGSPKQERQP